MTRRVLLLACLGLVAPRPAAASVHLAGRLTATDQEAQEGYFAFCSPETGACHPTDAIALSVHPANPLHRRFRSLVGQTVQFSLFVSRTG